MSRTNPDRAERIMLAFHCAYCGARQREWCRTERGGFYVGLHSPRFWLATDAGHLPLKADQ